MRARLPAGVRMYTGDDFNFAALIGGDAAGHSDALLGIFDAIAPAASMALSALAAGDRARFDAMLAPTVPLSRHIFAAPTRFYKTGVVFMAWLNGHQSHFTMVGGQQSARSLVHLAELFRLADAASLLRDPELAVARMRTLLALHGVAPEQFTRPGAAVDQHGHRARAMAAARRSSAGSRVTAFAAYRRGATRWRPRASTTARGAFVTRASPSRAFAAAACFPRRTAKGAARRIDDNRRAVDEALALGAQCLVLVVGGLPKGRNGEIVSRDLAGAREMVRDGLGILHEYAQGAGMRLAIEPLHPMYAADRACVNTLAQANALCDELAPDGADGLGLAVDVYHVWWDPQLQSAVSAPWVQARRSRHSPARACERRHGLQRHRGCSGSMGKCACRRPAHIRARYSRRFAPVHEQRPGRAIRPRRCSPSAGRRPRAPGIARPVPAPRQRHGDCQPSHRAALRGGSRRGEHAPRQRRVTVRPA